MTDSIRPLAEGFPAADDAHWRALADAALKGAPFERLVRKTLDSVERGPLFTQADLDEAGDIGAPGAAPFIRGLSAERDPFLPWGIRQAVADPDPKAANAVLLAELQGGVSEIALQLDPLGEQGVAVRSLDELRTVLDGVMLDLAPVHLAPSRMAPQYAALMLALIEQTDLDGATLKGGLGLSPIGQKSLAGGGGADLAERLDRTAEAAAYCAERFPKLRVISVTANTPYEAGGSEAQELAFACAGGASYMRTLIDHGLSADQAAGALEFTLAADADVHLTIAKLRAARRMWARVAESFGCSPDARGMHVHVTTGRRMLTARDPWTNLIRNACAGFAAAAGGADSITVRGFTDALGAPTAFARRLARNLQVLLMEESHLGRIADPAGGGFLHETLGARLAESGWSVFQDIERQGGLFETVKSGWLQGEIAQIRDARLAAYDVGQESLIGVSQFPSLDERPVEVAQTAYTPAPLDAPVIEAQPFEGKINAARAGAMIRLLEAPDSEWPPLELIRLAQPFEALRDGADRFSAQNGHRPTAFLATLGALSEFNARTSFAANRLAVAGIEAQTPSEHADLSACVAAFKESKAGLAVICGTDTAYADQASELASLLKAAGARAVWVAGRPSEIAGVDHFIHMRSNSLADGRSAHAAAGVTQ